MKILLFLFLIFSLQLSAQEATNESKKTDTAPKEEAPVEDREAWMFYWKSEYKELAESKKAVLKQLVDLKKKYTEDTTKLKQEIADLEEELKKRDRQAASRAADTQSEITTLTTQKETLEKELNSKTLQEKSLRDKLAAVEAELAKSKEDKNKLTQELTASNKSLADANKTIADLNKKNKETEDWTTLQKLIEQKNTSDSAIHSLELEKLKLKAEVDTLKKQLSSLSPDITLPATGTAPEKSAETKAIESKITETNTKIVQIDTELTSVVKERDELLKQLAKASNDPTLTPEKKKELETKLSESDSKISELSKEKDIIAMSISNAEITEARLTAELADAKKKISALEAELAAIKARTPESTEKLIAEKAELQKNLDAAKKELKSKTDKYESSSKELETRLESVNKELTELKAERDVLLGDLAALKDQLSDENQKYREELERLTQQTQKLEDALEQEIKKGQMRVSKKDGKITINLASRITFTSGSADIKKSGMKILNKIIPVLEKYPNNKIYVEGNTDNRPIHTNQFKDNWELSTERALSVLRHLLKKSELSPSRFVATGHGENNPVKPNTSKMNRAENRRVDIIIHP